MYTRFAHLINSLSKVCIRLITVNSGYAIKCEETEAAPEAICVLYFLAGCRILSGVGANGETLIFGPVFSGFMVGDMGDKGVEIEALGSGEGGFDCDEPMAAGRFSDGNPCGRSLPVQETMRWYRCANCPCRGG